MLSYTPSRNVLVSFLARTAVAVLLVVILATIFFYWFEYYNFKQELSLNFKINAWDIFKHRNPLSQESDIHDIKRYINSRMNVDRRIQEIVLYDEKFSPVYRSVRPEFEESSLDPSRIMDRVGNLQGLDIKILTLDTFQYIWVAAPIKNVSGQVIGYVEAVKKLSEADLAFFRRRQLITIAASILLVLLMAGIMLPLVLRAFKQLRHNEKMLLASNLFAVNSLGEAVALRDSDTSLHNFRATLYAIALGEELKLSRPGMQALIKGSFLHDIGKIGISDNILLKEGKLTDKEFEIIKTHVDLGAEIMKKDPWFGDALDVIFNHHERFSGDGYPRGIKGEEIPLNARIFAIVDVFDALTSDRPYRGAYKLEKAMEMMKDRSGTHFDNELLEIFLKIAPELYRDIAHLDKDVLEKLLKEKVEDYFIYC